MLGNSGKIVDNYKVDPGKLDSLVLRKGLKLVSHRHDLVESPGQGAVIGVSIR